MEGDDLLGCAMGILGLASTPAGVCGPTPTPAVMQPPPMTQLPPVQVPEAAAMPGPRMIAGMRVEWSYTIVLCESTRNCPKLYPWSLR